MVAVKSLFRCQVLFFFLAKGSVSSIRYRFGVLQRWFRQLEWAWPDTVIMALGLKWFYFIEVSVPSCRL